MQERKIQLKGVNKKSTKKMLILLVIFEIGYFGSFDSLNPIPEPNTIESVEIIYRWGDYFTFYYEYYKIKNENGTYCTSTGKEIDSDLILSLA